MCHQLTSGGLSFSDADSDDVMFSFSVDDVLFRYSGKCSVCLDDMVQGSMMKRT